MPHLETVRIHGLPHVFNLSRSVGSGGQNEKLDVMLVQYFLKSVEAKPRQTLFGFTAPDRYPTLRLDGICGTITRAWIRAYQKQGQHARLSLDGRVDPLPGAFAMRGPLAVGVNFTIRQLNLDYLAAYGKQFRARTLPGAPRALQYRVWSPRQSVGFHEEPCRFEMLRRVRRNET